MVNNPLIRPSSLGEGGIWGGYPCIPMMFSLSVFSAAESDYGETKCRHSLRICFFRRFFTDFTKVNHHQHHHLREYFWNFFHPHLKRQVQFFPWNSEQEKAGKWQVPIPKVKAMTEDRLQAPDGRSGKQILGCVSDYSPENLHVSLKRDLFQWEMHRLQPLIFRGKLLVFGGVGEVRF